MVAVFSFMLVILGLGFKASASTQLSQFENAYNNGVSEGIIHGDVSKGSFVRYCQNSVYPAYQRSQENLPYFARSTFTEYLEEDNYEQPVENDIPTVATSSSAQPSDGLAYAKKKLPSFKMKAGDIMVVYGTNSIKNAVGTFVGHAGMAISSKSVLHMPGFKKKAQKWSKSSFFKKYTKGASYVSVYRMPTSKYAQKAATYAYKNMYKKHNPKYTLTPVLYSKSPSYCSKYVYLAYYWGAGHTNIGIKSYPLGIHYVTPHGLIGNFLSSYPSTMPKYKYKIVG